MLIFFLLAFTSKQELQLIYLMLGFAIFVIFLYFTKAQKSKNLDKNVVNNVRYIPSYVKQKVWVRDEGKCVICGSRKNLEYDHDIPVSKGGSNSVNNIRLLCKDCNRKKSGKIE